MRAWRLALAFIMVVAVAIACSPPEFEFVKRGCGDGVINSGETDTDCGGGVCEGCSTNQRCFLPTDCQSGICTADGLCGGSACDDTEWNGTETDTDCGGGSCPACENGKLCE